jgi:transposase
MLGRLVLRVIQKIHSVVRVWDIEPWFGGWSMAQQVCVVLSVAERQQLAAIAADRNRPRKHVERVRIVLASADRHSPQRVAHSIGVSRPTVWRWQQRFAEGGVEGLLRDKTRKPGKPPIAAEITARVVALTCSEPPHQATHWTGRAMAKAIGISLGSVQRIWRAHKLQPHRLRSFKHSRDPGFAAKLVDIVGLYVDPPAHAVVLSLDEKSQIQALDRTQPGLPIKPGRCQTMTHDYKRHGTTTLFAALSVLDGRVIGRCIQRHRHSEFIRFLNAVERQVPAGKLIHAVLDNYATHKHPKVLAWLARHPRWIFHFTPTSASWLNAVENFFSKMTRQRIRRGVFRSIVDLQTAINAYLAEHNASPKPFVWTQSAEAILAKLDRLPVTSL